jgi:hypothetical protein
LNIPSPEKKEIEGIQLHWDVQAKRISPFFLSSVQRGENSLEIGSHSSGEFFNTRKIFDHFSSSILFYFFWTKKGFLYSICV